MFKSYELLTEINFLPRYFAACQMSWLCVISGWSFSETFTKMFTLISLLLVPLSESMVHYKFTYSLMHQWMWASVTTSVAVRPLSFNSVIPFTKPAVSRLLLFSPSPAYQVLSQKGCFLCCSPWACVCCTGHNAQDYQFSHPLRHFHFKFIANKTICFYLTPPPTSTMYLLLPRRIGSFFLNSWTISLFFWPEFINRGN